MDTVMSLKMIRNVLEGGVDISDNFSQSSPNRVRVGILAEGRGYTYFLIKLAVKGGEILFINFVISFISDFVIWAVLLRVENTC